ncbi:MAG TPA: GNAT family N-acetyltransferase [Burkholderiales bacterium]|jgi:predicted GNAT family N-acyltransferase|nr:GNAT family N-acetyltransferase [Burkholderiales bacterium]
MLKIELLDWPAAQREANRIRFTVFVEEQRVPPELEVDDNDATSLHALAYSDGRAIGTGRLLPDGHIGRIAVLKEWRGQGAGRAMLRRLIDAARRRGHREVALSAQVHALEFYRAEGFEPEGAVYEEAGIPHQSMRLRLV